MEDLALLLAAANAGDRSAADRAFALVYADLKRIARRQVRVVPEGVGATSLVHEAWLKLFAQGDMNLVDRQHFFALAARAMRQLVVDHARSRQTEKRGGGMADERLDDVGLLVAERGDPQQLIDLHDALSQLGKADPDLVKLVELRFFAGLDLAEVALLSGRSERSLKRDWRKARAILHALLDWTDEDG